MGGKMSRAKGCRGELEACEALAEVWPGLQRTYHQSRSGSDAPDIDGPGCPVWIEVKRVEALNIHKAMAQAAAAVDAWADAPISIAEADAILKTRQTVTRPPVIVHKRNRGEWLITMRVEDLARVLGR